MLQGQRVTDEVLVTAFAQVENLLNSRPLTYVSVNPSDPEPLTPFHLLLGRANPNLPPEIFDEGEVSSRKRWRTAQALADQSWHRWMQEYLPNFTERRN